MNGSGPTPVVRVRGLVKRYGDREAVRGVDLDLAGGEICGIIGPDGAGKSSLLKAVAGVLSYDGGQIDVFGVRVDSERAAERIKGRLGLMPQGLGLQLYPELSVQENIDFFARVRLVAAADLDTRRRRLLDITRLTPFRTRLARQLSGGMKQKLGLICTLIHQPALVVLDEPTTGIDPVSRRDFWSLLSELLQDAGTSALVSTAYLKEAERFDQVSLMFDGRLLATFRQDDLRAAGRPLEAVFVDAIRAEQPGSPPVVAAHRGGGPGAADPDAPAAIEAVDLTRTFGTFVAVDRVTFRVRPGEIVGLVGPNGAGKSTVIKMLTGLLAPSAGRARVAGVDLAVARQAVKLRIGYMSQVFSLYLDLSVVENIRLYAGLYGLGRARTRERVEWILDMGSLAGYEHTWARDLPMGLRQRLALGCALVHEPDILFLNEPTAGVDPIGRRRFWGILTALTDRDRVAVLLTTHDLAELEQCDRVGLMHAGRLVADAPPAALRRETAAASGIPAADVSMEEVFVRRMLALEDRAGIGPGSAA